MTRGPSPVEEIASFVWASRALSARRGGAEPCGERLRPRALQDVIEPLLAQHREALDHRRALAVGERPPETPYEQPEPGLRAPLVKASVKAPVLAELDEILDHHRLQVGLVH